MMTNLYKKIVEAVEQNQRAYLITVLEASKGTPNKAGAKMLLFENGEIEGTIGGGNLEFELIREVLEQKPNVISMRQMSLEKDVKMACGGSLKLLIEPLHKAQNLYIVGGGHCAIALSEMASKADFGVTVLDNRDEWANSDKHTNSVRTIKIDYEQVGEYIQFSDSCYVVVMTHQHIYDEVVLAKIAGQNYRYLGMIGSKNKVRKTFEKLKQIGVSDDVLTQIHSPIGLQINSHTPFEIAISIVAELIRVRNKS